MNYRSELYHHGILGQRWGKKNGPPYPLAAKDHSTSERKAGWRKSIDEYRNDPDIQKRKEKVQQQRRNTNKARAEYNRKTSFGLSYDSKSYKNLKEQKKQLKYARQDLDDARVKKALSIEKSKSKTRLKYEQEYLKKGLSKEDAEMQAYKRERMNKILKVSAGVAVAALAAYGAYKYHDYITDRVIKSGTLMSRINTADEMGIRDSFYASLKKNAMDRNKYLGVYAKQKHNQMRFFGDEPIYEKVMASGKDIKIASQKNAKKILQDIVKNNPSMKSELEDQMFQTQYMTTHPILYAKAKADFAKGRITKNVYDLFNMSLVERDTPIATTFRERLISKGYGAVKDMNDAKYSGYHAKLPIIVFDTSGVSVTDFRKLGTTEETARRAIGMADMGAKSIAPYLTGVVGMTAYKTSKKNKTQSEKNDRIVAKYRKEHPNSSLTYNEIIRMNTKK